MDQVDKFTATVLGLTAVMLIVYDIWVVWRKGSKGTISWTVLVWSARYPALTLAIGILIGHLVVPQYLPCVSP